MTTLARAADFAVTRPAGRVRTLLRGAGMFVAWAALGVSLALALTLLVPLAFHGRPLTVMSGSMEPTIMTGDVVIAIPADALELRPGDIVTFSDPNRGSRLITHRVRSMRRHGSKVDFTTKGDANNAVEKWRVSADKKVSRTVLRLPKLGRALVFARTRTGLLVLVLVPVLLLGTLEIASIWKDDEDDEDQAA